MINADNYLMTYLILYMLMHEAKTHEKVKNIIIEELADIKFCVYQLEIMGFEKQAKNIKIKAKEVSIDLEIDM